MKNKNLHILIENMVEKVITQTHEKNGQKSKKTFNFSYMKNIEDLEELIWYAKSTLPPLSISDNGPNSGSSRLVFHFGTGKVLKIARNDYGVEQNSAEIFASRKFPDLVVKTYDNDPGYKWILSEAVRTLSEKEFEQFTGIKNFNLFSDLCLQVTITNIDDTDEFDEIKELPFVKKILEYFNRGLDIADMGTIIHWGKNSSGELRYLDPGLSDPNWT